MYNWFTICQSEQVKSISHDDLDNQLRQIFVRYQQSFSNKVYDKTNLDVALNCLGYIISPRHRL
jgi:hypothetical protein